ncbi:MAG: adenylate/guanylate cyclase domain-containing protein [Leptolyngbyaceae cyanobacterium MO_188.B28]|nr:adenylate/guanylate cyclase domain-containing protein [Leptolyngbyaceae cyanobacterium MO_188.B28]
MWTTLRKILWEWRGVVITTPSIAGLVILLRLAGLLQAWEWSAFDQFMRLRPPAPPDDRVVIVGLDENDVGSLGQAIIPDGVYAELIKKLRIQEPRAIGLDIYRDLPVEPGHAELVEVFKTTPNLVGIQKVVGEAGRGTVAPPPVLKELGQVGANDLVADADNTVRRGLISVNDATGETVYSLSLYLALLYLAADGITPNMVEGSEDTWWLGQSLFKPFEANDGGYSRADAGGYQQLINYRGPTGSFETVSLMDVLNDETPSDWARDRIVLIGAVGESFQDVVYTPYSSGLLSLPEPMSGVEVHANLTSQIISAAIEGRPLIQFWSEPWEWGWILLWAGIGSTLIWQTRKIESGLNGWLQKMTVGGTAISVLLGCAYGAFVIGWWIPLTPALLALVGSATAVTGYLAHTASDIRKTFGRYLSDEVVTNLLENPDAQKLGGERRQLTILTSDLRGFTATAERVSPEEVLKVLNFYLGRMTDVITRYQGTIDEFIGDGILVLFGAPIRREDDARRAVACAVEMQLAMTEINQTVKTWGLPALEMGIGIHTGEAIVGNIGSEQRTKYGVVGSAVNLTYRIESYTIGGQILISDQTLQTAGSVVQIDGQKQVKPKGVRSPITIHQVGAVGDPYNLALAKEEELLLPLDEAIQVKYSTLSDKHVGAACFQGQLVQLSEKGALVRSAPMEEALIKPLTNIKLNLFARGDSTVISEDVYAKVLEKPTAPDQFYIRFTAKPPAVDSHLNTLYKALKA